MSATRNGGVILIVMAALVWSTGGVLVRGTSGLDVWEYLGWRSVGVLVCLLFLYPAGPGALFRAASRQGAAGWAAAFALALSSLSICFALKNTTVAFATFLSSIAPLLCLIIMAVVYRERISAGAIACVVFGLAGIAIMIRGDFSGGQISGNFAAALSALGFAFYSVLVNKDRVGDWMPAVWSHGWICLAVCAIAATSVGGARVPLSSNIVFPVVHGAVIIAFGMLLYNRASRLVAPFTLIVTAQTETVFAPVWGWLLLDEVPGAATIVGGGVIAVAVIAAGLMSAREAALAAAAVLHGAAESSQGRRDENAAV
jgi:drug/metabolite transporter (DMT)-like permease